MHTSPPLTQKISFPTLQQVREAEKAAAAPSKTPPQPAKRQRTRARYSPSEKATIVSECDTRDVDVVAAEYGVHPSSIYYWRALLRGKRRRYVMQARQSRPVLPQPQPQPQPQPKAPAVSARGLDSLHAQLTKLSKDTQAALALVEQMQTAFSRVFGGG
jgi:transposase-like protein